MKTIKLLIFLFLGFFIFQTNYASTPKAILIGQDKPVLSYTLDLGDITDADADYISTQIDKFLKSAIPSSPNTDELTCSVIVKGSVYTKEIVSLEITVTVSGPCKEIAASGATIANMVLEAVKSELKKVF